MRLSLSWRFLTMLSYIKLDNKDLIYAKLSTRSEFIMVGTGGSLD
jgi:hypothetical protein